MTKPRLYMFIGLILLLLGVLLPFLMIIKVLEPSYFLVFLTSAVSTVGLALGMIGLTQQPIRAIRRRFPIAEEWNQGE